MIKLNDDGTGSVSVRYSIRRGEANYSSQEVSMSAELDVKVNAETVSVAVEELNQLQDFILEQLKHGVIGALGMNLAEGEGTQPDFGQAPPAMNQQAAYAPTAPQPAPQGGGQDFGPPKATDDQRNALPRFQADFGKGLHTYIDQRPLKEAGVYSQKAPDFKNATDKDDAVWLMGSKGNPNPAVVAGLAAAQTAAASPEQAPF